MKKFILLIFIATSCSSSTDKMNDEIKKFVSENFHDPKSYEAISLEIIDTLFMIDSLNKLILDDSVKIEYIKIDKNSDNRRSIEFKSLFADAEKEVAKVMKEAGVEYKKTPKRDYESEIKILRNEMDSCYIEIQKTNPKKVAVIKCLHKYRAKNAVGALNLSEASVIFNDSIRLIHFDKIEQ